MTFLHGPVCTLFHVLYLQNIKTKLIAKEIWTQRNNVIVMKKPASGTEVHDSFSQIKTTSIKQNTTEILNNFGHFLFYSQQTEERNIRFLDDISGTITSDYLFKNKSIKKNTD